MIGERESAHLLLQYLDKEDSVLWVDNDMCYIEYTEYPHNKEKVHISFNLTPKAIAFILAEHLNINIRNV